MEREKEEKDEPKVRRNKKIIKIAWEINEMEYIKKKSCIELNSFFLENINQMDKMLHKLSK